MNYAEVASAGFPIGSDSVEAAHKVLVTARMKLSRQSLVATADKECSHSVR